MKPFDVERFRALMAGRATTLGTPCHYEARLASTSDTAKRGAKQGAPHGTLFVADEQTQGRGRHGRSWHAEPYAALLFSVVLKPPLQGEALSTLTLAMGLAVCEALQQFTHHPLQIKWPNDIYANERKLAGILLETDLSAKPTVVVGIGINTHLQCFPDELKPLATSLSLLEPDRHRDREAVLVEVLACMDHWLNRFTESGIGALLEPLKQRDYLRGRSIRVEGICGIGAGIDAAGRLLLRQGDGRLIPVSSGTVLLEGPPA